MQIILLRNLINLEEINCNLIRDKEFLNPDDPKGTELINKMFEEFDEECEDFDLYLSDNEETKDLLLNDKILDDNTTPYHLHKKKCVNSRKHKSWKQH